MRIFNTCVILLLIASSPFASAEKGMTVFAVVEHSEGAKQVGITLPPTQVIIFCNPKVGSLLMQCASRFVGMPETY